MVLGTCNFLNLYNGSILEKKGCFKILDYFYSNGGRMLDTAVNYHGNEIIKEWLDNNPNNEMKIITKIWNDRDLNNLTFKDIYCIICRDVDKLNQIDNIKNSQRSNKVGVSIYYTKELTQKAQVFIIPMNTQFIDSMQTMLLHADVYVRSLYNFVPDKSIKSAKELFSYFKRYERPDLNHKVDALIGVSNIEQLKENMREFK